ncbi:MAG: hypothetical protein ACE5IK_11555 [Acidobacteriota bacterium]
MTQRWRSIVLIMGVGLGLLAGGCAKPPEDDLARAEEALQAVRDAEGATYAKASLRDVAVALRAAQLEVETQKERFAILRNYDDAKQKLKITMEKAAAARTEAVEAKEAARVEAEDRLEKARAALAAAESSLEEAPRGKGTKADIAALESDVEGIKTQIAALEGQIAAEEYLDAQDKAGSIITAANEVTAEIQAAIDMQAKLMEERRTRR